MCLDQYWTHGKCYMLICFINTRPYKAEVMQAVKTNSSGVCHMIRLLIRIPKVGSGDDWRI